MGKYYAVKAGNVPGIYDNWAECEKQIKGFKGAIYKSFKTLEEAEDFYNSELDKAAYYKTGAKKTIASNETIMAVNAANNFAGRPPVPDNLDAVIYVDGSIQEKKDEIDLYNSSYGILLFSRNGIYVESTLVYDPENQNEDSFIDENGCGTFIQERSFYRDGHFVKQSKNEVRFEVTNKKSLRGYGMFHSSLSQGAEFVGASRAIDICIKSNFKKVLIVYDSENIVLSYNKCNAKSGSSSSDFFKMKVRNAKSLGMEFIIDEYTDVMSHENGKDEVNNPSQIKTYFGFDDYAYNDVVDILAKVQILKQPILTIGWDNMMNKIKPISNKNLALSRWLKMHGADDLTSGLRERISGLDTAETMTEAEWASKIRNEYIKWSEELVKTVLSVDSDVKRYFGCK